MSGENKEFELRGINHLALVCRDMARTVEFYCNVLGMPLTKTIELPRAMGQHFFFDPDGILLEFACWTKTLGPHEASHAPATQQDREPYLVRQKQNDGM